MAMKKRDCFLDMAKPALLVVVVMSASMVVVTILVQSVGMLSVVVVLLVIVLVFVAVDMGRRTVSVAPIRRIPMPMALLG
jgi:hypothetical protein